jgi:hypothetical protein
VSEFTDMNAIHHIVDGLAENHKTTRQAAIRPGETHAVFDPGVWLCT